MTAYEIVVPFWAYSVRTRDLLKTLAKIYKRHENVDKVAVRLPDGSIYVYVDRERFDRLMNGEQVQLITTLGPPFNRHNVLEAWGTAKFVADDFPPVK